MVALIRIGIDSTVASLIAQLRIKARDMQVDVSTLSGGNQQKVVLAKWFHAEGKVILLDEPTRGVDVGAKVEIYQLINTLAAKGMAVLVVSSDHNELIGLCDRILVMGAGRIRGELAPDRFSEENIVSMSLGMAVKAPQADAFTENHHA
jgi:ribose transport system ATP-binding protein